MQSPGSHREANTARTNGQGLSGQPPSVFSRDPHPDALYKEEGGMEINEMNQKLFTHKLAADPAISQRPTRNSNLLAIHTRGLTLAHIQGI